MRFPAPYNKPKRITFRRSNNTPISFEVTYSLHEILPGKLEEYTYTIDSNFYERATGKLQPLGVPDSINLRIKDTSQTSRSTTRRGNGYTDATPQRVGTSARGVNNGGALTLEGDATKPSTHKITKPNTKRKYTFIGAASTAIIAIILCLIFFGGDLVKKITNSGDAPGVVAENDSVNRDIVITFLDKDNDPIESQNIDFSIFTELVKMVVTPDNFITEGENKTDGVFELKYNVEGQASEIGTIEFTISLGGVEISDGLEKESFEASELLSDPDEEFKKEIKLSLRTSELLLYKELLGKVGQKITSEQKRKYQNKIDGIDCKDNHNSDIVNQMLVTLNSLEIEDPKPEPKKPEPSTPKSPTTQGGLDAMLPEIIRGRISMGLKITDNQFKEYKEENQKEQRKVLEEYNWLRLKKYNEKIPQDVARKLANCKTFGELRSEVRKLKKDKNK